ncbi:MAG: family 78 glycoside hydrolase catalytic domain [Promethearchaeota archaeon]
METKPSKIGNLKPNHLRCEYLIDPLGIDVVEPRFSWIVESAERSEVQIAYQILVASNERILNEDIGDLWDTGKVMSDQTTHITYGGEQLKSRMYCYWKVKVWDKNGNPSTWSKIAMWSMGLIEQTDWKAKWIGVPSKKIFWINKILPKKYNPCHLLRKSFEIRGKAKVKRAIIYATALGEYELYLNGNRVGDHILAPEWTDYDTRVQYQTYDVTELLEEENILGAILADGWYIGNLGPGIPPYIHHFYGVNRRLLVQMEITLADGIKVIITDSDWKILEDSPIEVADHFEGETYNVQKEPIGWDKPGFDDSDWSDVTVDDTVHKKLVAQMNEPIRIVKEIKPIEVTEPEPNVFIFNLGQNIAGWCKISLDESICEPDATITLRHGEMLKRDGTLYTKNLRNAKATDIYILKGIETRDFQPHFTYHGFQYVEVTGLKSGIKPNLDMLTGCVIASDVRLVGGFECSDPMVNKLWNNILWTQRDNMISVPTDCPQRSERMGWMGDGLVFCQTSIFNMDMAAFYTKWIQDMRDAQSDEGRFTDMVPTPFRIKGVYKLWFLGAPGWADCGVHLPWDVYLNYGDMRLLKQHFDSAKKFIDYVHSKNPNLIWIRKRGANYGDWLNGDEIKAKGYPKKGGEIPKDIFATAFFARSTEIVSKMANVIGLHDEAEYYRA